MTYLSRDEFRVVYMVERKVVGENLQRLRFSPPKENTKPFGLKLCEHISIKIDQEEEYIRHYSVASPVINNNKYIDIILKDKSRKRKSTMVSYLLSRKLSEDKILMKIGTGANQYKPNSYKHFGLIVGGSGVSPALQILNEKVNSFSNSSPDKTSMYVLFGAQNLKQLVFRSEFERLRDENDDISVHFTLDRNPTKEELQEMGLEEWKEFVGFADVEKIKKSMPPPGEGVMILGCGPFGMIKFLRVLLPKMGYTEEMLHL